MSERDTAASSWGTVTTWIPPSDTLSSCSLSALSEFKMSLNQDFTSFQMFQRLRPSPAGLGGQQLPRWGVFGSDRLGFSHLLILPDRLSGVADERQDVWHYRHHAPLPRHHRHPRQNHGQDRRGHCGQSLALHLPPSNQSPHWRYSETLHPGLRPAVFLIHIHKLKLIPHVEPWNRSSTALVFLFITNISFSQIFFK